MLGKKLGKQFDRMGYKLGAVPMSFGGKLNNGKHQHHQHNEDTENDKPKHSDLERRHTEHNEERHQERRRHHH